MMKSYLEGDKSYGEWFLEFSVNPDSFLAQVVQVAENMGFNEFVELRPQDIEVELSDSDAMASVILRGDKVVGLRVNPNYFDSRKDEEYVIAHEVSHLKHQQHSFSFYTTLKEVLNEEYGGWEQYQKSFEVDILMNSNESMSFLVDDQILADTGDMERLGSAFVDYLHTLKNRLPAQIDGDDEFDKLSGSVALKTVRDDLTITMRIGRGRGKSKLPIVEYDLENGVLKVNQSEFWRYPVDVNNDTLEFDALSNDVEEAINQLDNARTFIRELAMEYK